MCLSVQFGVSKCALLHVSQKDQLAADMYSFVSKEGEYARCFVTVSGAGALLQLSWAHTLSSHT